MTSVRVRSYRRRRWPRASDRSGFDFASALRAAIERRRLNAEIAAADEHGDRESALNLRRALALHAIETLSESDVREVLVAFVADADAASLDRLNPPWDGAG